jgi:hypothetical protein
MAGIQMTKQEFEQIVKCLQAQEARQVRRVLEQEKLVAWFEDIETEQCLFYDVAKRRCIVYPARPLVCRLFGRVEWLPCPMEKQVSQLRDGLGIIRAYATEKRATFGEWCMAEGLFDFNELMKPSE